MRDFDTERERMVEQQLVARGIRDERVLEAMREVPRHEFVSADLAPYAYSDGPLPIENGQTISQPYIVALMLEAAAIEADDTVLDVGTGSGYAAAVAARLARHVVSIERYASLAESARSRLAVLRCDNVEIVTGDGTLGWASGAPYNAIVAAATGPRVPQDWLDQLAPGGHVVMPIGAARGAQRLIVRTRTASGEPGEENLGGVSFVPLVGVNGWAEEGRDG